MNGAEQRIYQQMIATCSKPLRGLPQWQQQNCVLLKKQLEQDAIQRQLQLQQLAITDRLGAVAYVMSTMDALQIRGQLLLSSVIGASFEYDAILQARAAKPVLGDILLNVALMAAPELKILGPTLRWYWPTQTLGQFRRNLNKAGANTSTMEEMLSNLENIYRKREEKFERYGEFLDKTFGHQVHAARLVLEHSAAVDEETRKNLSASYAKNQMFRKIIIELQTMLQTALTLEAFCVAFIFWWDGDDVKGKVSEIFKAADIDESLSYRPESFDMLRELILYDMLRLYVKNYFSVEVDPADAGHLPQGVNEDLVEGLDQAQRDLIYDHFGDNKIPWKNDPIRPPINGYRDMIRHWGGRVKLYQQWDPLPGSKPADLGPA
jgi:hypothetical protein